MVLESMFVRRVCGEKFIFVWYGFWGEIFFLILLLLRSDNKINLKVFWLGCKKGLIYKIDEEIYSDLWLKNKNKLSIRGG